MAKTITPASKKKRTEKQEVTVTPIANCPEPGIYPGVSFPDYCAWQAVNNSLLWTLKTRSPFHAKWGRENPSKDTPAKLFGHALHTWILEPTLFYGAYAIRPDCDKRTKAGKAVYADFLKTVTDQCIITADDLTSILLIERAIVDQGNHEFIEEGRGELSIVWIDPDTGLKCKGRLDYVRKDAGKNYLTDLKSAMNAAYRPFQMSVASYGYYQQMAYYHEGWRQLTGEASICTWLACEKDPPYVSMLWVAAGEAILAGQKSFRKALDTYAECLESDKWPTYGDVEEMTLPAWALNREGLLNETLLTINELETL